MKIFRFKADDKFDIRGRHPVVTGKVGAGTVSLGEILLWFGSSGSRTVRVVRVEKFNQDHLPEVSAGPDDVALELEGIAFDEVHRFDVLTRV